jgi:hypothetical protein
LAPPSSFAAVFSSQLAPLQAFANTASASSLATYQIVTSSAALSAPSLVQTPNSAAAAVAATLSTQLKQGMDDDAESRQSRKDCDLFGYSYDEEEDEVVLTSEERDEIFARMYATLFDDVNAAEEAALVAAIERDARLDQAEVESQVCACLC